MKSPREYLSDRIYGVIEECGGDITDHTEELIDLLVTDVCGDRDERLRTDGLMRIELRQRAQRLARKKYERGGMVWDRLSPEVRVGLIDREYERLCDDHGIRPYDGVMERRTGD